MKNLSENRRGLTHFAAGTIASMVAEQNVPVPLSSEGSRIGSNCIVLCRRLNRRVMQLVESAAPLGRARVVEDRGAVREGYWGLATLAPTTAWDRAFQGIEARTTWFLEDDVSGTVRWFGELARRTHRLEAELLACDILTRSQSPNWKWWRRRAREAELFPEPRKSFNPICRLSGTLIEKVLALRRAGQVLLSRDHVRLTRIRLVRPAGDRRRVQGISLSAPGAAGSGQERADLPSVEECRSRAIRGDGGWRDFIAIGRFSKRSAAA